MSEQLLIALLAFVGTILGSCTGVVASARLTSYRLKMLEKKVDKHNNFAMRMPVIEQQVKEINHRLDIFEEELK